MSSTTVPIRDRGRIGQVVDERPFVRDAADRLALGVVFGERGALASAPLP
jgi:hypothetical protein